MNKITFEMNNGHTITFSSDSTEDDVRDDMRYRKTLDVPLPDDQKVIVNVCNIAYAHVEEHTE